MRTATTTIYKINELSNAARDRAYNAWLEHTAEHFWLADAKATIKAFEERFGIEIRDWEYSTYDYSFDLDLSGLESVLHLSGNRARSWLWNNHGDILLTGRYRTKFHGTKRAYSKFWFDRVYDGTCPLTGVCFDCDALDPLAYFAFGVKWDAEQKKRVPGNRDLAIDNATTIESLIRASVDSLFKALRDDCAYEQSMEYFTEMCDTNEWEFTADGRLWTASEAEMEVAA